MKSGFKMPIGVNVAVGMMLGLLGWHYGRLTEPRPVPSLAAAPPISPILVASNNVQQAQAGSTTPVKSRSSPQQFRWSQIESADYRTYIANLRGIGCPEQTIRDIITADLHSLYATRRAQLEKKLASGGNQRKLEMALNNLPSEEASVIALLLGRQPHSSSLLAAAPSSSPAPTQHYASAAPAQQGHFSSAAQPAASSISVRRGSSLTAQAAYYSAPIQQGASSPVQHGYSTPGQSGHAPVLAQQTAPVATDASVPVRDLRREDGPIATPLALQEVDPASMNLSPQQIATINDLRDKFVQDIGGPNQDPTDREYRLRWLAAQRESDAMMAGLYGTQFFLDYQIEAHFRGQ